MSQGWIIYKYLYAYKHVKTEHIALSDIKRNDEEYILLGKIKLEPIDE